MNIFYSIAVLVIIAMTSAIVVIRLEEQAEEKAKIETTSVHKFACKVCKLEGKKNQVNVAQVKEVLKVTNQLLKGELYKLITGK